MADRLKLSDIRRAVVYLREHFVTDGPLARQEMLNYGQSLFVEVALRTREPLLVNASRDGQLASRDVVGLHLKRIGWDESGVAARLYPWVGRRAIGAADPAAIVIDPRIAFGQPALASPESV